MRLARLPILPPLQFLPPLGIQAKLHPIRAVQVLRVEDRATIDDNKHIHLTKAWDKDFSSFFSPFAGDLSRNVNANWKSRQVMESFSDLQPEDLWEKNRARREKQQRLDEETQRLNAKMVALGGQPVNVAPGLPFLERTDAAIFVQLKSQSLRFNYEKSTKFLETVVILLRR